MFLDLKLLKEKLVNIEIIERRKKREREKQTSSLDLYTVY